MIFLGRKFIYLVILYDLMVRAEQPAASTILRQKRSLIFPPTAPTRVQFICGIGIPVEDLHYESITSGYVLKAEYFLPTNATEIYKNSVNPQTINKRSNVYDNKINKMFGAQSYVIQNQFKLKKNNINTYRWTIYKAMEQLADRMGFIGRACILKSVCEVASTPFHHASGILAEIAHLIMTPSSSIDTINHHSNNEYFHAEILGRSGAACSRMFAECQQSFMKQVSTVLNFPQNIINTF